MFCDEHLKNFQYLSFFYTAQSFFPCSHREKFGTAAIDSLLFLPNSEGGTFEIVTTECLRPPGCGAGDCDKVAGIREKSVNIYNY